MVEKTQFALGDTVYHNRTYGREDVPSSVAVTIQDGNKLEDDTRAKWRTYVVLLFLDYYLSR